MKTPTIFKKALVSLVAILMTSMSFAQNGFNYKALITTNGNALSSQPITFRFTVLENGNNAVYQETQNAVTDANGIVAVNVGEGTVISGDFSTIDWGSNTYFLKVEIDTGSGYQDFGTSELKYVPYAKYADKAGNVFSGDFNDLTNVPTGLSDGDDINDADHDPNNEIQTITKTGNTITLSNGGGSVTDSDTHLTEAQVDAYVANNGYLTQVDNIQGIPVSTTAPANGQVLKFNGTQYVPANDDTSSGSGSDGVVNSASFSGSTTKTLTLGRSNGLSDITATFTDAVNDADHDSTNEIQTLSKTGNTITLSNGGGSVTDSDTHLSDSDIAAMGYIKDADDADHDPSNEIQNLSVSGNQLTISQGNTVTLPTGATKLDDLSDARSDNDGSDNGSSIFIGIDAGTNDDQSNNHNVGIGYNAMYSNTAGNDNTATGYKSLYSNTTGIRNSAFGGGALYHNTTGHNNIAFGHEALYSNNTGFHNSALGSGALHNNLVGSRNTATGSGALYSNTTGYRNTATGSATLSNNTSGYGNTAFGQAGLYSNTTGHSNVAVGVKALYSNTDRSNLVAVGDSALYNNGTGVTNNLEATQNTALGSKALFANTTGYDNTASGFHALYSNTSGNYNTATGNSALSSNTTGNHNTANGNGSLASNTTGSFNTAMGSNALHNNSTGAYNAAYGRSALYANTTGSRNTANGYWAMHSNTTGAYNVASGFRALNDNTTGNGNVAIGTGAIYHNTDRSNLVAVGDSALYNNGTGAGNNEAKYNTAVGSKALYSNTTGFNNTANGYNALYSNTTGFNNSAYGSLSLYSNTSGWLNTAIGRSALYQNTTGFSNTAIGNGALFSNTTGDANVATGYAALSYNTTGDDNTAYGTVALASNTTGNNNSAFGEQTMYSNTTGSGNTAVGRDALSENATGWFNTALGFSAFFHGTNYSYSTALGFDTNITASNQVRIGNSTVTSIGGYAAWTNLSDRRFKTDVQENVVGLPFIMKLRPVTYRLDLDAIAKFNHTPDSLRLPESEKRKAAELQTGFIAQEVEQAAQSVGYDFHGVDKPKNDNDYYGLRYAEFVVPLTKAVQELNQKHDEEVQALKTTIQNQQNKIETLETKLQQQASELQNLKNMLRQFINAKKR